MNFIDDSKGTCFFISSSDNTFDVFSKLESNFNFSLPSEAIKVFVGLNKIKGSGVFESVSAPIDKWNTELIYQLKKLPFEIDFVILVLDDFYFKKPINLFDLNNSINFLKKSNGDYLRLVPLPRPFLLKLIFIIENLWKSEPEKIKESEPYYSSLQVALWRKDYLIQQLVSCNNIWHFERLVIPGSSHFAVRKKIANYIHLVEKGMWLYYAKRYVNLDFKDFQKRKLNLIYTRFLKIWDTLKFFFVGFYFSKK